MSTSSPVDLAQAHRHFSTHCFNGVWELIDKPNRSPEEDASMLLLSLASLWHWTQRADRTSRNLSVGHWLASRVHALLGDAQGAHRHAAECLRHSQGEPPFYRAYAQEALARAAMVADDGEGVRRHLAAARELAATVTDPGERGLLESDLTTLEPGAAERRPVVE